jgi:glycosyltransferase involved in cell wall biosynthesis
MADPRISVIVPNYNHARYLPQCLGALLDQPVPPHEILVLDDASTDNSREVIEELAGKNPVIRSRPNERNLGVCRTMNRGLELAEGDYVMFPAADDQVKPGVFEWAIRMLREHPGAGLCSGVCEWRCADTGMVWYSGSKMPSKPCYLSPSEMVQLARKDRFNIAGQNAVYKKASLIAAGGWIPELRWFTDWFGACVVGFREGMCHVPDVLSIYNLHTTSYYNSAKSSEERREVMAHMLQLLGSEKFADVAGKINESGLLGGFGWNMVKVLAGTRKWEYFSAPFCRQAARRSAEVVGRRLFPAWFARLCLKLFYAGK